MPDEEKCFLCSEQLKHIEFTVNSISTEMKEQRKEIQSLKQEMSTGKGAIRAVTWIGVILGAIYTWLKIVD